MKLDSIAAARAFATTYEALHRALIAEGVPPATARREARLATLQAARRDSRPNQRTS